MNGLIASLNSTPGNSILCNSYLKKKELIDFLIKEYEFNYIVANDALYIFTEIGEWKICCDSKDRIVLYHANKARCFEEIDTEIFEDNKQGYHYQNVSSGSIDEYIINIKNHDDWRYARRKRAIRKREDYKARVRNKTTKKVASWKCRDPYMDMFVTANTMNMKWNLA